MTFPFNVIPRVAHSSLLMRILTVCVMLVAGTVTSAAAQPRTVRLSSTATIRVDRDPIEDTDHSQLRIQSGAGVDAQLHVGCAGRYPNVYVSFAEDLEGSMLVLRFGSERPDSFPQPRREPMKVWGDGSVRLVQHPPTGIASIPTSAVPRLRRGLQAGQRLVARLDAPEGRYDAYFETAGVSRGLEMLSCLRTPSPSPPRVLGRSNSQWDYDGAAVLLDSTAVAAGLSALRPMLDRAFLPYAMVNIEVSAEGTVDSAAVIGLSQASDEERVLTYLRGLRYHPAEREGQPVRSSIMLFLYRGENLPRRR